METGADNGVPRRSAVSGRSGKGTGIEPCIGGSGFETGRDALNGVGAGPQSVVVPCVAGLGDIEGSPACHGDDAAKGPAAQDKSLGAFPGFRKGDFPKIAQNQPVALIVYTGSALGLTPVARILAQ